MKAVKKISLSRSFTRVGLHAILMNSNNILRADIVLFCIFQV